MKSLSLVSRVENWFQSLNLHKKIVLSLLILTSVSFFQYSHSLGNDFVWDAKDVFLRDPSIRNIKYFPSYFTEDFFSHIEKEGSQMATLTYYRPLVKILHFIEFKLFDTNPTGYNAVNILLNILVIILCFFFVYSITGSLGIAFTSALLYSVNPTRVEIVSWPYSDSYLLVEIFSLASLYLYHKKRYVSSFIVFAISLLSQEIAVLLPLILIVYEIFIGKEKILKVLLKVLPFILLVCLFLVIRSVIVGNIPLSDIDFFSRLNTIAVIIKRAVKMLFIPDAPVTVAMYKKEIFSTLNFEVMISYFLILLILILGIYLWVFKRSYLFWYFWFFIWNMVSYNVGAIGDYLMAEKVLHMAAIGHCVLIAVAILNIRIKKISIILIIILVGAHFSITYSRTLYWTDTVTLIEKGLESAPNFYLSHYALGSAYVDRKEYGKALIEFEKTIKIFPHSYSYNNIGNIYALNMEYEKAAVAWGKAIEIDTKNYMACYNLGLFMERKGDLKTALEYYKKYVYLAPQPLPSILSKIKYLTKEK